MTRTTLAFAVLAVALASTLSALPAQAQRAFVGAQGSDSNPCTFALPCRTFQHAHDTVAAGGEIDVLDPAGYGAVTVTKAISIQGHGFAGISVTAAGTATGITIAAGANDAVHLNGLLIDGSGAGHVGISFGSGRSLVVESCVVRNMTQDGLRMSSNATTLETLSVADSYFADNGANGVFIGALSSGAVTAVLERSFFSGNLRGLSLGGSNGTGPINVAVSDSAASNNSGDGFAAQSAAGHSVLSLVLTRATAAGNQIGVDAIGTNANVRLAQSTVTGNVTGYSIGGGTVVSYGDNYIDDNGGNTGALGGAAKQ
jgi:hypothetical protein